eukprot:145112_1
MRRPGGKKRNIHSMHDDNQISKAWKNNTMAPRPSAKTIMQQGTHDEFIILFQQQLAEAKKEQFEIYQRKASRRGDLEKRKSVPDFAMLSGINQISEDDVEAHRHRLSTLKEGQLSKEFDKDLLVSVEEETKGH